MATVPDTRDIFNQFIGTIAVRFDLLTAAQRERMLLVQTHLLQNLATLAPQLRNPSQRAALITSIDARIAAEATALAATPGTHTPFTDAIKNPAVYATGKDAAGATRPLSAFDWIQFGNQPPSPVTAAGDIFLILGYLTPEQKKALLIGQWAERITAHANEFGIKRPTAKFPDDASVQAEIPKLQRALPMLASDPAFEPTDRLFSVLNLIVAQTRLAIWEKAGTVLNADIAKDLAYLPLHLGIQKMGKAQTLLSGIAATLTPTDPTLAGKHTAAATDVGAVAASFLADAQTKNPTHTPAYFSTTPLPTIDAAAVNFFLSQVDAIAKSFGSPASKQALAEASAVATDLLHHINIAAAPAAQKLVYSPSFRDAAYAVYKHPIKNAIDEYLERQDANDAARRIAAGAGAASPLLMDIHAPTEYQLTREEFRVQFLNDLRTRPNEALAFIEGLGFATHYDDAENAHKHAVLAAKKVEQKDFLEKLIKEFEKDPNVEQSEAVWRIFDRVHKQAIAQKNGAVPIKPSGRTLLPDLIPRLNA